MRRARICAALAATAAVLGMPAAAGAQIGKRALTFSVMVGPGRDQPCKVDADLYTPAGASRGKPVPAVLATNGFGGSKGDFSELGAAYAERGYAFLAYSGLGFGRSGCKITLDDREHDGAAGSELVSFLGGSKAAGDGTKIDYIVKDATDQLGNPRPDDPRVGMIGGSYGGEIQFALAAVDARLDTIIPQITWNDLSYSLSPNNTGFTRGVTYATPGVVKLDWPVLFFGLGTGQGLVATPLDPSHAGQCPNFSDAVCAALVQGALRGHADETGVKLLRNSSVSSYYRRVQIPTFLTQGQSDNLFNLQEAVATYKALKAQNLPVKMLWRSAGHSSGGIGRSESDSTNLEQAYESRMQLAWFDHYLKGTGPAPALDFSFLTDWIPYPGGGDAAPSVGSTAAYPVARQQRLFLSGSDALVPARDQVRAGAARMNSPAVLPASTGGGVVDPGAFDLPGTSVSFTTGELAEDLDLAGVPSVTFRISAPAFEAATDPALKLVLFAKLYDVAPDGTATLHRDLISAARVADPSRPVKIELPGLVHRVARGHRLRLTLATTAATYRGSLSSGRVTITTAPEAPGVLKIPRLGAQAGPVGSGPSGTTPFKGLAAKARIKVKRERVRPAARFPRRRACRTPRALRFKLRSPRRLKVARVTVNSRRVKTLRGRRLRRRVTVRVPRAKRVRVVVTARTRSGAQRRSARTFRACR